MKRIASVLLILLLLGLVFYIYSCRKRNLRGWWKDSNDGKTYLVIEAGDGGSGDDGNQCFLDGKPWPRKVGERGEIEPGEHEAGCPAKVGFVVKQGTEFHLDYWGP